MSGSPYNLLSKIKKSPLFLGITEEELSRMLTCFGATVKKYESGDMIIRQGDVVSKIYMILDGVVNIEKDWVPHTDGASLYIRPFIIACDPFLGVRPADTYKFIIILSPSGAYYSTGLNPVSIYVEQNYVRAVKGGMGYTKTGGNYAASLAGQDEAHKQNYSQVLWLDGIEKKYVEEVGSMNIFFIIDGELVTPELQGSILSGITRKSVIELAKSWGLKVSERRIAIQEVADAYDAGKLDEVFGTGTAAVISPVGTLKWGDKVMTINDNKIGPVSQKIYDTMTGMQYGKLEDKFGWIYKVTDK